MSYTPRTDALDKPCSDVRTQYEMLQTMRAHARQLELELHQARKSQREADLELFKKWRADLELPFGVQLTSWHTFNVSFEDFLRGEPLERA